MWVFISMGQNLNNTSQFQNLKTYMIAKFNQQLLNKLSRYF
jgi:hypothetical protein